MSKELRDVVECLIVVGLVLLAGHFYGPDIHARTAPLVHAVGSPCRELAVAIVALGGLAFGLAATVTLSAAAAITARCGALTGRSFLLVLFAALMCLAFYGAIPGFVSAIWMLCAAGFLLLSRMLKG